MSQQDKAEGKAADKSAPGGLFGVLAEFDTAASVYAACEKVRDAGFKNWDSYTPFPVHNLDRAMGLKDSTLPWAVLVMGLIGASSGMTLQWWVSAVDYPITYAAKPFFSWQAFVPITFELGVLFAALTSLFAMLHFNRLPQYYHPLFQSERFERVTDDRFFIAIEADDPKFDPKETADFLKQLGATHIETVEE